MPIDLPTASAIALTVNTSITSAIDNDGMRVLASCFAILALGGSQSHLTSSQAIKSRRSATVLRALIGHLLKPFKTATHSGLSANRD
jgi:hypothetical protein